MEQVEVWDGGGGRAVVEMGVGTWPDPGQAWEQWASRLLRYPSDEGLARADEAHRQALTQEGRRYRREGEREVWDTHPPVKRQRRSVEQISETQGCMVRKLAPRRPPPLSLGEPCGAMAGCIEGLSALLMYDSTDDAIVAMHDPAAVRLATRGRTRAPDPLRARFGGVKAIVARAFDDAGAIGLGGGGGDGGIAADRLRTRATWSEIACKQTRAGCDGVKGLRAVETRLDATRGLRGLRFSDDDEINQATWAALRRWLVDGERRDTRAASFRADALMCDWSSDAILAHLRRSRRALEEHLQRAPKLAEGIAFDTGDKSFLAPLVRIQARPEREKSRRQRESVKVEPVRAPAPRWM